MHASNGAARSDEGYFQPAILIWIVTVGYICTRLIIRFTYRNVTPTYHVAIQAWIDGQSMYGGLHYFPQFVFMFYPFHVIPAPWGDILWRLLSSGLLAWALWRLLEFVDPQRTRQLFFYGTLVILVPSFDALRNGQANVIFAALTTLAAVSLAQSRWNSATVWLILSMIAKPIGVVMIVLAAMVYREMIWRVALGILIFLAYPFAFGRFDYVWSQYRESIHHLFDLSVIIENHFADLNGLLRKLGIGLTGRASQGVRAVAGMLTAMAWWLGSRKFRQPEQACFLLAITTIYLMLFNPMTEENSYVIVMPVLAYYGFLFMLAEDRRGLGWSLILAGVSMGVLPEPLRKVLPDFGLWWRPIVMFFFGGILIDRLLRAKSESPDLARSPAAGMVQS